jgi:Fe-S cluster assembly ATP-binding protein
MLQVTNLCVAHNEQIILHDISLIIKPGAVHAVMGPNGSGKSTFAVTLMGHPLYSVKYGSIIYNGEDITAFSPHMRAKKGIFLSFQHPLAIPGVSLATMLKEAHQAVTGIALDVTAFRELLYASMDLLELSHAFADRAINEGCSGGERKRLEMLQLLVLKPSLAILDEIDSGLDVDALQLVAQALMTVRAHNPSMSIIMITHYNRIVQHIAPDAVHILSAGRIMKSGERTLADTIEQHGYSILAKTTSDTQGVRNDAQQKLR